MWFSSGKKCLFVFFVTYERFHCPVISLSVAIFYLYISCKHWAKIKTSVFLAEKLLLRLNSCSPPRTMELSKDLIHPARLLAFCHNGTVTFAWYLKLYCECTWMCMCVCMYWASPVAQWSRICLQCRSQRRRGLNPWEDCLEEDMAAHSSIPAWRIPWTGEPGGLQSIGSQSGAWLKQFSTHTCIYIERVWIHTLCTHTYMRVCVYIYMYILYIWNIPWWLRR